MRATPPAQQLVASVVGVWGWVPVQYAPTPTPATVSLESCQTTSYMPQSYELRATSYELRVRGAWGVGRGARSGRRGVVWRMGASTTRSTRCSSNAKRISVRHPHAPHAARYCTAARIQEGCLSDRQARGGLRHPRASAGSAPSCRPSRPSHIPDDIPDPRRPSLEPDNPNASACPFP